MNETVPNSSRLENTLLLQGDRTLVLDRQPERDVVRIVNSDGQVCLTIHLTPAGPVLKLEGSVMLEVGGALAVNAEKLAFHGRSGVAITSGGDMTVHTSGDLHTKARIQNITAELGNVNMKANDDVKISGERVLVNCVET